MPRPSHVLLPALLAAVTCAAVPARAGEPFRFPEARHGKGELKYFNGLPVLTVEGTPEEIGEQVAVLAVKPAARVHTYPKDVLNHLVPIVGVKLLWPRLLPKGKALLENFPPDYRKELEVGIQVGGFDRDLAIAANTMFDLKHELAHLFGCSALIVEASRSRTGQPFFGRNMDYLSLGYLHEYSLVTVYRPQGKRAFVSVGYPGMVGAISGMNDAGLSLAVLETTGTDQKPAFDPQGTPFALCYRRILEECATVGEAEKLLRSMKRTATNNLTLCDRSGGAVFEVTPRHVVVRRSENGIGLCTNHYCSPDLKLARPLNIHTTLDRFAALQETQNGTDKMGVADMQRYLDRVNQGKHTLQTMVFEPATLTLHLAIGRAPSSAAELKKLDLVALLKNYRARQ